MRGHLSIVRFAFLYLVASAAAVGCAMTYSWITNLGTWQTVLLVTGCLIGGWATVFSFLELSGLVRSAQSGDEALREKPDPYAPRTVLVAPPTGEPYPHHEDHAESAGFDQGQLTSRLTETTPLIDAILTRRSKEQKAAR